MLTNFGDYLERFGVVARPVLDSTQRRTRYTIHCGYQAQTSPDYVRALAALGLGVEPAARPVELLVLR